jgi:hypothetical protein
MVGPVGEVAIERWGGGSARAPHIHTHIHTHTRGTKHVVNFIACVDPDNSAGGVG